MNYGPLIINRRLGRLNTSVPANHVSISLAAGSLTMSDTTVTHDVVSTEPSFPAASLAKKAVFTTNRCRNGLIRAQANYSSSWPEQGPEWSLENAPDGWYSMLLVWTKRYTFSEGSNAALLAEIAADTVQGSVIAWNYQGGVRWHARTSGAQPALLPHEDTQGLYWEEPGLTHWDRFTELILMRGSNSTMIGEAGLQQVFLTGVTEGRLADLAISGSSCMDCCHEELTEYSVLRTRLFAARALFCRGRYKEAADLLHSIDLECRKFEKCDCC